MPDDLPDDVPAPSSLDSFVALGDSFTEGLHDELGPDGRHRGWADRVADGLATANGRVRYANLAIRGRLLDQVVAEQVPVALALKPALVSFNAGGNDALRPRADLDRLFSVYEQTVARLRENGSQVLLFTTIGPPRAPGDQVARGTARLIGRFTAYNDCVRRVAAAHDCVLADIGSAPALRDRRLWHEDRLHLTPEGHARVAAAALEALGLDGARLLADDSPTGWWREPLPARVAAGRLTDLAGDLRWAQTFLLPWIGRRLRGVSSGDSLLPKRPELIEITAARP
ncbi:SGNH/GDSL hydrolase family protein [Kineosporia sp. J2-2]|uniref:SGNH/GDSL hydrolase family protein n=1 Tax=Kineosporia corallincola TaxID=2835133 RepID=A0ABS5TMZ7_9ACTN|nr:SGNH/GDSL hydrolase family protein [Kineosporia corallincola]MBT0772375.1 SGNH/GDSL hydrolase family protein [Kineosporia corallincola]